MCVSYDELTNEPRPIPTHTPRIRLVQNPTKEENQVTNPHVNEGTVRRERATQCDYDVCPFFKFGNVEKVCINPSDFTDITTPKCPIKIDRLESKIVLLCKNREDGLKYIRINKIRF